MIDKFPPDEPAFDGYYYTMTERKIKAEKQKMQEDGMREVKVRETVIGSGIPKICVPFSGKTEEEILEKASKAAQAGPDLLEWRADAWEGIQKPEQIRNLLEKIRKEIRQIPLIFTVRTYQEGGSWQGSTKDYVNILQLASESPHADLLDVEFARDPESSLTKTLKSRGKTVIMSRHHFTGTPSLDTMTGCLREMETAGADIRKLAVMPQTPEDVLKLLEATCQCASKGTAPVITMAMGKLGAVSRISGQLFGSCVTFGTVGEASAPGQLELPVLREILKTLELPGELRNAER